MSFACNSPPPYPRRRRNIVTRPILQRAPSSHKRHLCTKASILVPVPSFSWSSETRHKGQAIGDQPAKTTWYALVHRDTTAAVLSLPNEHRDDRGESFHRSRSPALSVCRWSSMRSVVPAMVLPCTLGTSLSILPRTCTQASFNHVPLFACVTGVPLTVRVWGVAFV